MNIEHKQAAFELKREPDADGLFEGYASVFGVVDDGLDVVDHGAFTKTLGQRKVRMLWQHNMDEPIGVWEEIREDHRGLFVKGRLLKDVQKGREALALLRAGAMDSMSIGYSTVQSMPEGNGSVRKLIELDLWEISLVTIPMLADAVVTDVKKLQNKRDVENILRDAGISNRFAKLVAIHGFDGAVQQLKDGRREADGETDSDGINAIIQSLKDLKGQING